MATTRSREEMIATLCRLAAEQVGADPAAVTLETHFVNDLQYDSLDQVEFTMTVEETFEVDVSDEQASSVRTVGDVLELITEKPAPV